MTKLSTVPYAYEPGLPISPWADSQAIGRAVLEAAHAYYGGKVTA